MEQTTIWRSIKDKPETFAEVVLWRTYGKSLPGLKRQTGFFDVGVWDGAKWQSRGFGCEVSDVKFWHELPPTPEGER